MLYYLEAVETQGRMLPAGANLLMSLMCEEQFAVSTGSICNSFSRNMRGAKERKMGKVALLDKSPQSYKDNNMLAHVLV